MRPPALIESFKKRAPGLTLGAFFCAVAVFTTLSCSKKGTPDWETTGHKIDRPVVVATGFLSLSPGSRPVDPPLVAQSAESSTTGLRFISYNVQNWLTMDRFGNSKPLEGAPKPESEKSAAVEIIYRNQPDILGLSEIGTPEDLREIQSRLREKGLNLPHSHFTGGSDSVRHLGFLSKFPIVATGQLGKSNFKWEGNVITLNRGILDASVEIQGKTYRFLGIHLKSKREVDGSDQESIRRGEAHLVRFHVDSILKNEPGNRLIVYGDFNDTRASSAFKTIAGQYSDANYLTAIPFQDRSGTSWTHFWALHEIYSRIDFVTVSRRLKPETDFKNSKIIDDSDWNDASDHRPVLAIFR